VSRHNLAILIEDDGRLDESVTIHELNLKFWEGLAASETSNQNARSKVALTLESLAILLEKIGRKSEVEPVIRRAVRQRSDLTKDFPNTPYYFGRLAGSLGGLANLAAARGDLAEARRLQEQALVARRSELALAPGNVEFTKSTVRAASVLLETLMRLNAHEAVAETTAELVSLVPDSAKELIQAGSFLARCVSMAASDQQLAETRRAELAKMYADRAVAMVRKAIEKGHHDLEALQKDPSFDSLRARADFAALLGGSVASAAASAP
jgi:tetratricopeptide (TPR) repeat protein